MKQCKGCGEEKPLADFSFTIKRKTQVAYYRNKCKKCMCAQVKEFYKKNQPVMRERAKLRARNNTEWFGNYYQKNREKNLERNKLYRQTIEGRVTNLFNSTKQRALKNGLEFDLTKDFFRLFLLVGKCARTGIEFDLSEAKEGRQRNKYSPSIDRKDRRKGYTWDNVQLVVWCYNTGKGEMEDHEFIEFCKIVAEKHLESG